MPRRHSHQPTLPNTHTLSLLTTHPNTPTHTPLSIAALYFCSLLPLSIASLYCLYLLPLSIASLNCPLYYLYIYIYIRKPYITIHSSISIAALGIPAHALGCLPVPTQIFVSLRRLRDFIRNQIMHSNDT